MYVLLFIYLLLFVENETYTFYVQPDEGQKQILPITHYIQNQLFLIILHISNLTVI